MRCLSWQEWYIKLPKCGGGAPHNHHTEEASSRVPRGVACLGDKCWAGCWSQLKQSSSLCTVGTLRLEWHAFGCFYYLYKPKSWSVSRHTARLSLWIMNSNEAFCMIIWWVIWMQSSFGDVGEKNNTGCVWMAFFDAWPFLYDLLFWYIQFEKQTDWYSMIDYFAFVWRKPWWLAWKKYEQPRDISFLWSNWKHNWLKN